MLIWEITVEDTDTNETARRAHLGENENEVRHKVEEEYSDRSLQFIEFEIHGEWLSEDHGGPILDSIETHSFE